MIAAHTVSAFIAAVLTVHAQKSPSHLSTQAASAGVAADSAVFSGRLGRLDVVTPRVAEPEVALDGRLDEAVWQSAAVLTDFTQYEPVEGIPATEDTEVMVFYSADAIYFGIRALDRQPEMIIARMGERDRAAFSDDWVRLMLDTFDDQRQAYVFYVNPLGLQTDGLWLEGMNRRPGSPVSIDFNPDFIWESNGRLTEHGWEAEVKIPYISLRFREVPVQDWGFNVAREVKRRGFKQSWAPLTQNETSTLAQGGHLRGLRDLRPRRLVEINPVATGKRAGEVRNEQFVRDGFDQEIGLNARYGITRNLVLDATINPDFSQVEADANQITVNERFALFFPEKRPFFLEGAEIFRTPRNLVHTRRIVDPSGGAKVTGKIGPFNVGYLGAVDDSPQSLDGGDNQALFNLIRVRRDVGPGSTVGVLYTDRTLTGGGGYNRVLGGDARVLLGRYTVTTQLAGSFTSDSLGATRRPFRPLLLAQIERTGRTFGFQVKLDDVHPDFLTRSGFIPRVGDTELFGSVRATWFGVPGSTLQRVNFALRGDAFFEHDAFWHARSPFESEVELQTRFEFRGASTVTVILRDGFFQFHPVDYAAYEVSLPAGGSAAFETPDRIGHLKAVGLLPRMRLTNAVQLNGRFFYREVPLFEEAARGLELQVGPEVTLQPTTAFQLGLQHTYSRLTRTRDHSRFSTVHISRLRTQYQFTKALFARIIVQYDLEDRDALRDPATERDLMIDGELAAGSAEGSFQGQFLLSYEPSPGTIFFIGYNRLMEGDRTYRLSRLDPVEDALFVKLSYLFRL